MTDSDGAPQFKIRLRDRDVWLGPGTYLIGRGAMCHLVVDDARVSRRHAELIIRPGSASIRDIGSANGVFVDGVRVGREPEPLLPGCRIVVGDEVLEVGTGRPPPPREAFETLTGEEPRTWVDPRLEELPTMKTLSEMLPPLSTFDTPNGAPTQRFDVLEVFAPVAVEALRYGRAAEAEQLLGVHLKSILAGAKGGALPKPERLTRAVDLALDLALAGRAGWVDFAVDLLCTTSTPPDSEEMMDRLEKAARLAARVDVERLDEWVRILRGRMATLDVQHLDRLDRVEGLVASLVRAQ